MALQQMIDKKNTFLFILWILSSFYPGQMLSTSPLKIVHHPHLLSVGDDRKFV